MSLISKLIIREWNRFFVTASISLLLLTTVANLISGLLRANVSPHEVLLNYILELPKFIIQVLPISCLIASLFSINKLKNRNELTAIFASGYSRKKYIFNIIQASAFIALIQFLVGAYVEPFAKSNRHVLLGISKHKFRNLQSKGLKSNTIGTGKQWFKNKNYFFSFEAFDKQNNSLREPVLFVFDKSFKLSAKFSATSSYFENGQWHFIDGVSYQYLNSKSFPEVKKFANQLVPLNETPEDFKQLEADITTLSIGNLYNYIRKLKKVGINTNEYTVMLYRKFSSAIICVIFALIASLALFNPNRRNSVFGKNILIVFVFTVAYWLINSYIVNLGINSKIPPLAACFSVPIVFILFLAYFFNKNKRLQ